MDKLSILYTNMLTKIMYMLQICDNVNYIETIF